MAICEVIYNPVSNPVNKQGELTTLVTDDSTNLKIAAGQTSSKGNFASTSPKLDVTELADIRRLLEIIVMQNEQMKQYWMSSSLGSYSLDEIRGIL